MSGVPAVSAVRSVGGDRTALVLALNEAWHDLEGHAYDAKHPDILADEVPRWRRLLAGPLGGEREPVRVLDVGSGTGFVPMRLAEWLRAGDALICSDISAAMLEACRANALAAGAACPIETLKLDGGGFALPPASIDLVTMNAVMHHLPDPAATGRDLDRVLKPGGWVLVAHEPTRTYAESARMKLHYWATLPLADLKQFAYEIILRLGLFEFVRKPLGKLIPALEEHNRLIGAVNARLLSRKLIDAPLSGAEISSLLDAQSPDAGGPRAGRGFSPAIIAACFPGYAMTHAETYTHLGKTPLRKPWIRRHAERLARKYPELGANVACVLRKPGWLPPVAHPRIAAGP